MSIDINPRIRLCWWLWLLAWNWRSFLHRSFLGDSFAIGLSLQNHPLGETSVKRFWGVPLKIGNRESSLGNGTVISFCDFNLTNLKKCIMYLYTDSKGPWLILWHSSILFWGDRLQIYSTYMWENPCLNIMIFDTHSLQLTWQQYTEVTSFYILIQRFCEELLLVGVAYVWNTFTKYCLFWVNLTSSHGCAIDSSSIRENKHNMICPVPLKGCQMAFKGCHWASNTPKKCWCAIAFFGTFFVLAPWYRSTNRRTKELFFRGSDHEIGSRFANGMAKISMFLKPRSSGMQHCMLRHWWVYNGLRAAKCLISPGVAVAFYYAHSIEQTVKITEHYHIPKMQVSVYVLFGDMNKNRTRTKNSRNIFFQTTSPYHHVSSNCRMLLQLLAHLP